MFAVNHDNLRWERRGDQPGASIFFVSPISRNQPDLLVAKLDLELIAGPQLQHGGVGLTHQQVAVALHRGDVAQASSSLSFAVDSTVSESDALSLQQGLIERCEVQPFAAVFLCADIAYGPNEIGLGGIALLLDLGQQFRSSEGHVDAASISSIITNMLMSARATRGGCPPLQRRLSQASPLPSPSR